MDELISDLLICDGYAVQADRSVSVPYDAAYFDKCAGKDQSTIADAINECRVSLVSRHYGDGEMLDVGIGSGEFVRRRPRTYGFDVNPVAIEWLHRNDLWSASIGTFAAVSFWDVLEHLPEPTNYLKLVAPNALVFASIPVFDDLTRIRESKHYRPNEHFWYWQEHGFCDWMAEQGFTLLESNDDETRAGRDSIQSFAFKRHSWQP